MRLQIEPAGHRLLVELRKVKEKTSSGIILTANTADLETASNELGEVKAIGSTAFEAFGGLEAWGIEVGDFVLFAKHGGKRVAFPGYDEKELGILRIINDEDVIAKVMGDRDEILKEMEA